MGQLRSGAVLLLLSCFALARCVVRLPKCCPLGEALVGRPGRCRPQDNFLEVRLYDSSLNLSNVEYELVWKPISCAHGRSVNMMDYWILEDGSLNRGPLYKTTWEFCLEELVEFNLTVPLTCSKAPLVPEMSYVINSIGYLLSIPFGLATVLVYVALKELSNLHGKIVICSMSAFTLSAVSLTLTGARIVGPGEYLCKHIGYAIQFFFMATFFWLNVMCFDIYWAFSGLKHLTGSVKERERKKLILYSCYAWGLPLLILLVTIGIDYSPYVPNDSIFKPGIGVDKCFFQKDQATGIYFYMPMGCVLVINIVLFSITAYRIFTLRRETAVLKRGDSRKHDNTNDKESVNDQGQNFLENKTTSSTVSEVMIEGHKDPYIVKNIRFSLYLKLFLVMGINWVMELLSYLAGGPSYIWYIPDFTNTLQGVFIFIIFVWKERVRKLIWAKMSACCGCKTVSNRSRNDWATSTRNTSTHTSSSGINTSIKMTPTVTNGTTTNQTMTA